MKQHDLFCAAAPRPEPAAPTRDAAARRTAVTEFGRPLLLEAGAGTGKTATLVGRVVHWCLGPGWELEAPPSGALEREARAARVLGGVVAVTFTEAAAAGMSTRLGLALADVEAHAAGRGKLPPGCLGAALPSDAAELGLRAGALRAVLDHLNASTIHAFCRRILAAHPLEAGLRPEFEVDSTLRLAEVAVRDAIEELLHEAWEAGTDADWIELARRGFPPPEIEAAAVVLVTEKGARARDFVEHDPLPERGCARALEALQERTAALRERALELDAFRTKATNTRFVLEALDATAAALAESGSAGRAAFEVLGARLRATWLEGQGAKGWERFPKWAKDGLNQGEGQAISDHAAFLAAASAFHAALEPLLAVDPELLALGRRVLGSVLARVETLLRQRGVATFSDLLSGACALLRDPSIAARERGRIRQLVVDEFQDTDQEQCEIVGRLALEGERRPGLFLVGDPKQSIFAWRNADLGAYDDFAARLEAAGGERLTLDANFRSHAAILGEVERIVGPVMDAAHRLQPPFVPLEPARSGARSALATPAVEHWVSWVRDGVTGEIDFAAPKSETNRLEARAVARDIARLRDQGQPLQGCALILRGLTSVDVYLRELRAAHLPYEVQSDRNYYQRREVLDAAALVRTLLDPTDHLALVAFLRSPAVGLPDAALLPLWAEGFPGEMTRLTGPKPKRLARLAEGIAAAARRIPEGIPGLDAVDGWEHSLLAAVRSIARLRASFQSESADRFIEELRAELLSDAAEAARYLGEFRLANLERFFRELLGALEASDGDARTVLAALRADVGRADRNEASRPGDARRDAVQVLTIHGSKGLEFAHVYLVQTDSRARGDEKERAEFARRGGEVAYRVFGAASLAWAVGRARREEIDAAERVRLLYVMLTRAAERLVILGAWPERIEPRPWRRAKHANDLCCARAGAVEAVAEALRVARAGRSEPHVDRHGVAWRLAEPEGQVGESRIPAAAGGPAALGAGDARDLADGRERALRRMARPFSSSASAEAHVETSELAAARFAGPESAWAEPLGRAAARAAGTAVHRLLEALPFDGDLRVSWLALAATLPEVVARLAPAAQRAAALARAEELVQRIAAGSLLERLAAISGGVLARELCLLAPPGRDDTGAVGFQSGAADLVYRDPESGELVVADYKSDLAETDEALVALAAGYRAQGAVYTSALREALALEAEPRFELWFLHAGRVLAP